MTKQCHGCGATERDDQLFAVKKLPLMPARAYCPICEAKLYSRICVAALMIIFGLGFFALIRALQGQVRMLYTPIFFLPFSIVGLWLSIVPHELGHAIAARLLGCKNPPIIIGLGFRLFTGRFLGFQWLFNLLPLDGVTILEDRVLLARWKQILIVVAGPAVSLAMIIFVRFFIDGQHLSEFARAARLLFLWFNVLVLMENLVPHRVHTSFELFELVANDGLQIWNLLFGKEHFYRAKSELLGRVRELAAANRFSELDGLLEDGLSKLDSRSELYRDLLMIRIYYALDKQEPAQAEALALEFSSMAVARQDKIRVLDRTATGILSLTPPRFLEHAERLARTALQISPNSPGMKGTLGAVLAEQGKIAEAEPLLRQFIEQAEEPHEQGIGMYYLGVVMAALGHAAEAERLMKQAAKMWPEPWLKTKVKAGLTALGR